MHNYEKILEILIIKTLLQLKLSKLKIEIIEKQFINMSNKNIFNLSWFIPKPISMIYPNSKVIKLHYLFVGQTQNS